MVRQGGSWASAPTKERAVAGFYEGTAWGLPCRSRQALGASQSSPVDSTLAPARLCIWWWGLGGEGLLSLITRCTASPSGILGCRRRLSLPQAAERAAPAALQQRAALPLRAQASVISQQVTVAAAGEGSPASATATRAAACPAPRSGRRRHQAPRCRPMSVCPAGSMPCSRGTRGQCWRCGSTGRARTRCRAARWVLRARGRGFSQEMQSRALCMLLRAAACCWQHAGHPPMHPITVVH